MRLFRLIDEAIRLDPKDAVPWTNKGVALFGQGKVNEATRAFDEAIKSRPPEYTYGLEQQRQCSHRPRQVR